MQCPCIQDVVASFVLHHAERREVYKLSLTNCGAVFSRCGTNTNLRYVRFGVFCYETRGALFVRCYNSSIAGLLVALHRAAELIKEMSEIGLWTFRHRDLSRHSYSVHAHLPVLLIQK